MHYISIIIPTLNEAVNIKRLLLHLVHNSATKNIAEIIIVDCGSDDGTQEIVKTFITSSDLEQREELYREVNDMVLDTKFSTENFTRTDVRLYISERGRAKQMNLGAQKAVGNILYFLHADSFPPENYDRFILTEVKKGNLAGCFKMKFDCNHWWLQLAGWLTQFKWRACRGGDQSQFITKELFNELGSFNEQFTIYEDNDLINKLYAKKQFTVIQEWITTSARRYQTNGVWKLQYHFWTIYVKKWFGASADDLHTYYLKHIKE
ncbi:MAG: glycosyltransferase [Flavobacteriaceae bacterium]|nr:glycosyltransferase [Flavobacteriaceae bacterium]